MEPDAEARSFVYQLESGETTVTGKVTWLNEEPTFRFAVMPEDADDLPEQAA